MLYLIGEILKTLQFLWRFQTSEEFVEKNMSRGVVGQITGEISEILKFCQFSFRGFRRVKKHVEKSGETNHHSAYSLRFAKDGKS